MAMIECPECGRDISSRAVSCPGCGCPIEPCERCGGTGKIQVDNRAGYLLSLEDPVLIKQCPACRGTGVDTES
jgi:hypothetical protein